MAEEFLGNVPKKVADPAITLLAEQREVIEKWLVYEAYLIQRRSINDIRRSDFYLGMLTNIKILLKIFESKGKEGTYKKDFGKVKTMEEYKKELDSHLAGVKKFKNNGVDK
jgi:hypothetical protein